MATVQRSGPSFKSTASNLEVIGDASEAAVSAFLIHIVMAAANNASIVVKGRSRTKEAADASVVFQPIVYHKNYLNGAVADGTLVSTAITDTSIIMVPASGMQIALDSTYSTGTVTVYFTPVVTG